MREYYVATAIDGTRVCINQVSKVTKTHHKMGSMVWSQF